MKSFRTELENPVVEQDIIELNKKILEFKEGKVDEERFRSLRLARGVYGQRQPGVQMIRIKIPMGIMTRNQFLRILDVTDTYSTGKLHFTTRQDIQIHHVKLEDSPQLWSELEKDDVTLREACGNTVRNITASALSGLTNDEAFDVMPYAHATFQYFLRNPVCQEMGRKFKISFSNNDQDSAKGFMHDLGFIGTKKEEEIGFKVLIGGGLGAQPFMAQTLVDFLPIHQLFNLVEATLRVFDQYGERNKRHKARFKFLLKEYGLDQIKSWISTNMDTLAIPVTVDHERFHFSPALVETSEIQRNSWIQLNTFTEKWSGYRAVGIKVPLGDLTTDLSRQLITLLDTFGVEEYRITIDQNLLIPHIKESDLQALHEGLKALGLAEEGYESIADVTACPGTDTCNLAITNSTNIARHLEELILEEYSHLLHQDQLSIKISGCMNSCGQHVIASIGLHGSTIKTKEGVVPAMQILLGGGFRDGCYQYADKVIKIPTKRIPDALRTLLTHFELSEESSFQTYYDGLGKKYFYDLLKPLADTSNLQHSHFQDWASDQKFSTQIGVGECAGVVVDLVKTLLLESEEKIAKAEQHLQSENAAFAVYEAYGAIVNAAKSALLNQTLPTNNYRKIVAGFQEAVIDSSPQEWWFNDFSAFVFRFENISIDMEFANAYTLDGKRFVQKLNETLKR